MRTALLLVLALAGAASAGAQAAPDDDVVREIRLRTELLATEGSLQALGATVRSTGALLEVYARTGYAPLWEPGGIAEVARVAEVVQADGLDPAHYHLEALRTAGGAASAPVRAELDLLATDALLRLAHDVRFGKAEPVGPTTGRSAPSPFGGEDPAADAIRVARSERLADLVLALRPRHFVYVGLVDALAELRRIQQAGGWPAFPEGRAMRRDSADARVPALRARLRLSGDLAPEDVAEGLTFDAALEDAVRRFQHRHGLNEDGVVGPATIRELNVPVERRIEQLRVNLERARWVTHELPETFVAVNIAGARVYLVRGGDVAFETRAIVGRSYTRTPVFSAVMRTIDLNPTWTVPPGIVGEVLANVREDPGYLAREGMHVLDRSGRAVDPSTIDFSAYSARSFPYVFRQDPGPRNPLGRIKFLFPNEYNVYLHDTPSRGLFEQEERLFSHGCIRVQDPLALAELILDDPAWSRAALEAAIEEGGTRTVRLARPLPVLILYWTASADLHGELHFYRDVYGRDAELLAALNRP